MDSSQHLHFWMIDLRYSESHKEMFEFMLRNIKQALLEFLCLESFLLEESGQHKAPMYALVAVNSAKIDILVKPHRFDLEALFEAIKKLTLLPLNPNPQVSAVNALEMVSKYVYALKKRVTSNSAQVEAKITFFSPHCLPSSPSTTTVLESLYKVNASVELVYVVLPSYSFASDKYNFHEEPSLNTSLASFALIVREWINCSLIRVENQPIALRKLCRGWLNRRLPSKAAQIVFSNATESILCTLEHHLLPNLDIQSTQVCSCHHACIGLGKRCSVTENSLESSQIIEALKAGTNVLGITEEKPQPSLITFMVVNKLKQGAVSLDVLYGQTFKLTPGSPLVFPDEDTRIFESATTFDALCLHLNRQDMALLVTSKHDLNTGKLLSLDQMRYYMLFPSECGTFLVMPVACAEQIMPVKAHSLRVSEEEMSKAASIIDQVEAKECFNPMDFEMGMCDRIFQSLQAARQVTAEPPKPQPQVRSQLPTVPTTRTTPAKSGVKLKRLHLNSNFSTETL